VTDVEHAYAAGPAEPSEATADPSTRSSIPPAPSAYSGGAARGQLGRIALFHGRGWLALRVGTDAALLLLGNVAALLGAPSSVAAHGRVLLWLFPALTIALLAVSGLYRDRIHARIIDGLGTALAMSALAAVILIAGAALFDPDSHPADLLARAWLFGSVYLAGGRLLLAWTQRRARATRLIAKPTLIVGAGQVGAHVERRLDAQPELGLLPIGYLDADPPPDSMVAERRAPVLGGPVDLREVAARHHIEHVVLGFSSAPDRLLIPLVRDCEALGLEVSMVPRLFESVNLRLAIDHLGGLPLFGLHTIDPKGWQFTVKHVLDRVGATLLLGALAPLMLLLFAAVRLSSPGPALFRQDRIGRDGRRFQMLKFRTMEGDAASLGLASNVVELPTDVGPGGVEGLDRRTRLGTVMRRTSLDELPQLFNVLKGEMSLVGPRPERAEFVNLFGEHISRYDDRHRVKSGITGWAQVNGLRGRTSLRDRVEWDNYYIENWSLGLDLKILIMTLSAPFTAKAE
jgi:exopolysaccharide biosynthesis polyprenyl glycosylphosphotransferase